MTRPLRLLALVVCLLAAWDTAFAQWNYEPLVRKRDPFSYRDRPFEVRVGVLTGASDPNRDAFDDPGVSAGIVYTYAFAKTHSVETGAMLQLRSYYRYDYQFETSNSVYYYSDDIAMLSYPVIYQFSIEPLNATLRAGVETNVVLWGNRGNAGSKNPDYNALAAYLVIGAGARTEDLNFVMDYVAPIAHPMTSRATASTPFRPEEVSVGQLRASIGVRFRIGR
jgi:hypothetical protein